MDTNNLSNINNSPNTKNKDVPVMICMHKPPIISLQTALIILIIVVLGYLIIDKIRDDSIIQYMTSKRIPKPLM